MMTIQEYFNKIMEEEGFDAYCEQEDALWKMYDNDYDFDLQAWCEERGIDYYATKKVGSTSIKCVVLWAYDRAE